ncbi:hypothetical protein ACPF7Z_03890 [Halomonas sp. GXIMD04776]
MYDKNAASVTEAAAMMLSGELESNDELAIYLLRKQPHVSIRFNPLPEP